MGSHSIAKEEEKERKGISSQCLKIHKKYAVIITYRRRILRLIVNYLMRLDYCGILAAERIKN